MAQQTPGHRRIGYHITAALDTLQDLWIRANIALSGYRVAALIMLAMFVGARADTNNPLFGAIALRVPIMTEPVWEVLFLVCAVRMWSLKSGRWEVPSVLVLFIAPLVLFYGFLLILSARTGNPSLFIEMLIILAVICPVILVSRTASFNYYRDHLPIVLEENRRLREECEKLGGCK